MDRKKSLLKGENQGSLQLHKNIMATNSGSSIGAFIASLKFMKKTKHEVENNERIVTERSSSPKESPTFRRRTHSADSIYDEVEFSNFENESKKAKKQNNKHRRKSLSRKNFSSLNGDDALHNAVMVGNVELARQTLFSGNNIDVNAVKAPGWTAMHHACRLGNIELIKLLADAGANLSYLNSEGISPLRLAVMYGHFEAATYLIHEQGVSCDEIRDGFQEKRRPSGNIYYSPNQTDMKHPPLQKTKSYTFE